MGLIERLHRLDEKVGLGPSEEGIARQLAAYPAARTRWDVLAPDARVETYLDAVLRSKPPPTDRDVPLWLAFLEVAQRPLFVALVLDVAILVVTATLLVIGVTHHFLELAVVVAVSGLAGLLVRLHRHDRKRRALLEGLPPDWPR